MFGVGEEPYSTALLAGRVRRRKDSTFTAGGLECSSWLLSLVPCLRAGEDVLGCESG
jgi:hypothetical protein